MNQELTSEIASPTKFFLDFHAQMNISYQTKFYELKSYCQNPQVWFYRLEIGKHIHVWLSSLGSEQKTWTWIARKTRVPKLLGLFQKGRKLQNTETSGSNLIAIWTEKNGYLKDRTKKGETNWPKMVWNSYPEKRKNRWIGEYFEFNEPRTCTSTGKNKQQPAENVSSTEENDVVRPIAIFLVVDLQDYEFSEKASHYAQVNHKIEKTKIVFAEGEENLKEAEFSFTVDLKAWIHKTSVEPKLLQVRICQRNNKQKRAPKEISPVFSQLTERFGLLFPGDKIVWPEELKKQMVEALHFGHPGLAKILAESNIFWLQA